MTTLSIAICAHISRREMAEALRDQLDCPISMDDGSLGDVANHDATLQLATHTPSDWVIGIEDDALPVTGFREQAAAALAVAPAPIAALYYGYIGAPDEFMVHLLERTDPHWAVRHVLANTVCLAIRGELVEPILGAAQNYPGLPCDGRYERAAFSLGQCDFAYSWPSLVEHADVRTVRYTPGAPRIARRAYAVGTRPRWGATVLRIPEDLG